MSNNNDTVIIKVSQLTGSRLVNLDEFVYLKGLLAKNPTEIDPSSLVFGYILSRANRLNLNPSVVSGDFEKIQDEAFSVLKHLFAQ